MRVGFFGTPDISVPYLERLAQEHEVVTAVTQPDRARGRSKTLLPPAVKQCALDLDIPVLQPEKGQCRQVCECLQEATPDICVVVAFGQILPCGRLDQCGVGTCINVHYSLLPQLRGAAPVQHAIWQGLEETGVTIQHVAPGLDEGDIILQESLTIPADATTGTLMGQLTEIGIELLMQALAMIERRTAPRTAQDHSKATFAPTISKQDGRIDWSEPADAIERKIRAFNPWPSATTTLDGKPLKIHSAAAQVQCSQQEGKTGSVVEVAPEEGFAVACGQGRLWVKELQPAGKKPMRAQEYLRGARLEIGAQFG